MDRRAVIAKEISRILPTFIRHMYSHVFQPIDVPPSQLLALVAIQEKHACTLSELKGQMHVSAPTITGIIDRLEEAGFVNRVRDDEDRRVTHVSLTPKGHKLVQQFRHLIEKRWRHILSKMPPEVGETVIQMLRRITEGLKDGTI